jgi:hypothetical protein
MFHAAMLKGLSSSDLEMCIMRVLFDFFHCDIAANQEVEQEEGRVRHQIVGK